MPFVGEIVADGHAALSRVPFNKQNYDMTVTLEGGLIVPGFGGLCPKRSHWAFHRSRFRWILSQAVTLNVSSFPVSVNSAPSGHIGRFIVPGFGGLCLKRSH